MVVLMTYMYLIKGAIQWHGQYPFFYLTSFCSDVFNDVFYDVVLRRLQGIPPTVTSLKSITSN